MKQNKILKYVRVGSEIELSSKKELCNLSSHTFWIKDIFNESGQFVMANKIFSYQEWIQEKFGHNALCFLFLSLLSFALTCKYFISKAPLAKNFCLSICTRCRSVARS